MLRFLGNLLTTILGVFITFLLIFFVLVGFIASQSDKPSPYVRDNSVLNITLSGSLLDRVTADPFAELFEPNTTKLSLELLSTNLPKAAKDDRIKGIVIYVKSIGGSWATLQEARNLLLKFKESGKFIYAYTDDMGFSEASYYLASVADKVMSPPESFFEFDGFYVQGEFYNKLFDKIGVKPEITRYGKYKSAIEPYIRTNFSNESREQLEALLATNVAEFTTSIAESRGLTPKDINNYLNATPDLSVKKALERKLVDSLIYPNEFESFVKSSLGVKASSKIPQVKIGAYDLVKLGEDEESDNKIAVIYADGIIVPNAPSSFDKSGFLTFKDIDEAFDKALENKKVKAIVLRITSPGGSGSTADLMWNKIKSSAKDIPVIASMGSVAASGGYYMAVATDTIFADPTTITGSIGVFSTKFNVEELFADKIGITHDVVKSHTHSDWINPFKSFTKDEDAAFQGMVNQFYETFLDRVDEGRLLNREQIHAIAQGRVWSGVDAQKNGLVDVLGSLDDAIAFAAKKAGVETYSVVNYPKPKSILEQIMSGANQTMLKVLGLNLLPEFKAYFTLMQTLQNTDRRPMIHALMPLEISIK